MSSNNNHSNPLIDLSNYEEWFLLYVDEELNAEERKAVEAFAAHDPQLREELDLLCSTRLPAEPLVLQSKSELFSGHMKMNSIDESLLLYIDNELSETGRKEVEQRLAADQDLQLQYRLLLKTRSDATELIPFPDKKSLYRTTKERRIVPNWLRIAAAVLLVAGTGAAFWLGSDTTDGAAMPSVAVAPATLPETNTGDQLPAPIDGGQPEMDVAASAAEPVRGKITPVTKRKESKPSFAVARTEEKTEDKRSNNLPVPVQRTDEQVFAANENKTPGAQQQNNNNTTVTTPLVETYDKGDATNTTPVYATNTSPAEGEKSGSLKGFLRKATRFIERRTGVSATNENDELLIGAVAIKLK